MAEPTTAYRRPGGQGRTVREVVFDRLPLAVRDRLGTSLARGGAPQPLISAARGRGPGSPRAWAALAFAAAFVDVLAWFEGFGDPLQNPRLSPLELAIVHAVAIATALFAAVHALRLARARRGVPYAPGRHVFELDLVEVDGPDVRVTSLDSLRSIEARSRKGRAGQAIVLCFSDGHEVALEGQTDAEALAANAMAAVRAANELVLTDDLTRVERLDPFFELRVSDDWSSAGPAAGSDRTPLFHRAPLVVVAGVCAGVGALAGGLVLPAGERHLITVDDARLAEARTKQGRERTDALDRYVRLGGRRAEEAREEMFDLRRHDTLAMSRYLERGGPRAAEAEKAILESEDPAALEEMIRRQLPGHALADERLFQLAKRAGSSKAFEIYLKVHGWRWEEAERLQQEAVFAELVRKENGIDPLLGYLETYPSGLHAAEVRSRLKVHYDAALQRYFAGKKTSEAGRRFLEAVADDIVSRADREVIVRVQIGAHPTVAAADSALWMRHGVNALRAVPHLEDMGWLERAIQPMIADWLFKVFSAGAVKVRSPQPGEDTSKQPNLVVTCRPIADGTIAVGDPSPDGAGKLVYLTRLRFQVDFRGSTSALRGQLEWTDKTPAPDMGSGWPAGAEPVDSFDLAKKAYGRMIDQGTLGVLARIEEHL